jgi:hypothetical protein
MGWRGTARLDSPTAFLQQKSTSKTALLPTKALRIPRRRKYRTHDEQRACISHAAVGHIVFGVLGVCGTSEDDCLEAVEHDGTGRHEMNHEANWNLLRSTYPRPDAPTARARSARSTPSTKSHNTRLERYGVLFSGQLQLSSNAFIAGIPVRARKASI